MEDKQELLRASAKEEILDGHVLIPEVHFLLAQIYTMQERFDLRDKEYDLIINKTSSVEALSYLKSIFEDPETYDEGRLNKVMDLIASLTVTSNALKSGDDLVSEKEFLENSN